MNPVLEAEINAKRGAIATLCERYGVASLDLFGSGTSDAWQPEHRDLDFVVSFLVGATDGQADRYLGLAEELEALFKRPVDLTTPGAMKNPYFRAHVDACRSRIYSEVTRVSFCMT